MRLLHAKEHYFEEFYRHDIPEYGILSHCWSKKKGEEMTFQDWITGARHDHPGYKKIADCCRLAQSQVPPLEWVWVDTICESDYRLMKCV